MEKFQISLERLRLVIAAAEKELVHNTAASTVVEFDIIEPCDTHLGNDIVIVGLKSIYGECDTHTILP